MDAARAFGVELRRLRRERGISLAELSALTHYSKGYLSKIETGKRSASCELARSCEAALATVDILSALVPERPARSTGRGRPAQLPPGAAGFTGRAAELAQLDAICLDSAGAVTVIVGPPGVGKTALAVRWASTALERFPDGCLFCDLRGYDPSSPPAEAIEILGALLNTLMPSGPVPSGLAQRSALLRTLVHGRRLLMVLDNAATPGQVRPLLPSSAGSQVIITSRTRLSGLVAREAGARIRLQPLDKHEAQVLLARTIGPERVTAEIGAAAEIAERCGNLPLALRIVAARAQSQPALALASLARQLSAEPERLDALATGDDDFTAVRAAFSWSYRTLPSSVARMFKLLSLHPGAATSPPAAASLAAVTTPQAGQLLDRLADAHLLEDTGTGRFHLHDLLRLYATERASQEDPRPERDAAVRRMLIFYLHSADAADRVLMPRRRHADLKPDIRCSEPMTFSGYLEALAWCDDEHTNVIAAARVAAELGEHAVAWGIPAALWGYFNLRKHWDEWMAACQRGLDSARVVADRPGEAQMLIGLGTACADLRRLGSAQDYFNLAWDIRRELGDLQGEGSVLINVGNIACMRGNFREAVGYFDAALHIFSVVGDSFRQGIALNSLGEAYRGLHRPEEALDCFRRALASTGELGDRFNQADTLHNLGDIYRDCRRPDEAMTQYCQALGIRREIGDRVGEARTLHRIGDLHAEACRTSQARQAWQLALVIFEELNDPQATQLRPLLQLNERQSKPPSGSAARRGDL